MARWPSGRNDTRNTIAVMIGRLQRLLVSEAPGSPLTGLGVAALWVAATTALIYPLKSVAPVVSLGVV